MNNDLIAYRIYQIPADKKLVSLGYMAQVYTSTCSHPEQRSPRRRVRVCSADHGYKYQTLGKALILGRAEGQGGL